MLVFAGAVTPAPVTAASSAQTIIAAGHKVEVAKEGELHFDVLVDGKSILSDKEDLIVSLRGSYVGGGHSFVVVEKDSGGTACPATYQAIDLSGPEPSVSKTFGNCSDIPNITVVAGVLRITFPRFKDAPARTETFSGSSAALPAGVADVASAEQFIRDLYQGYVPGPLQNVPRPLGPAADKLFEPGLLALIRREGRMAQQRQEVVLIDSDPICECQDWDHIRISRLAVEPDGAGRARATVTITDNGRPPDTLRYELLRLNGQWRIRDIQSKEMPSFRLYLETGLAKAAGKPAP
jgi:hypothetical protein